MTRKKNSKWDGQFSNLKISEQGYPELYRELAHLHHKERSDRLRSLALLGLYSLHRLGQNNEVTGSVPTPDGAMLEDETTEAEVSPRLDSAKMELKGRLLGSVATT